MKVLFLTNVPSPYRVDFFNELGKLCDLTVLFETKNARDRDLSWVADKITDFRAVFLKGVRKGEAEAFCPGVISYLSKKKYDIIVVGMYSSPTGMLAVEYMKIRRIPFVLNTDGGLIRNEKGFRYRIKSHFIKSASAWLSSGKLSTDYLSFYGADRERTYIYPFTSLRKKDILEIPIDSDEKKAFKEKLGISEEKMVLSVGQFIHRKGYDLLLKTCKDLPKDIGIYIVGGEPTEEYLEIQKKLSLDNVHFVGFKKKQELSDYYKAANLFVLPTREDIWGLVINEAMAYGLPVITTDKCVAGMEMISDNGRIVPVPADWSAEITKLLSSDDINKMSVFSIEIAKKYSIENMAKVHIDIFKKLLEK